MTTAAKNIVGPNVRSRRIAAGLSQEALVARCNMLGWDLARGTLAKIETRLRRINDAEAVLLARALNCHIQDLTRKASLADLVAVARQGRSL